MTTDGSLPPGQPVRGKHQPGAEHRAVAEAGRTAAAKPPKGLRTILAFFCLLGGLIFGFDAIITAGLKRIKTSQFGVSNQIVEGKINAAIVISGSSRALAHYDPRVIQSVTARPAFNLGRNGSQTDMQVALLKTYLKHNRKPEVVLHNLDAFSFVTTREVYDPAQYIPYLGEEDLYRALHRISPSRWWKSKYLPLYGYVVEDMRFNWISGLKGFCGYSPPEDYVLGFNPRSKRWSEDFERYQAMNPAGVQFEIEAAGIRDVTELAEVCQRSGIRLILVYSPEFRGMQLMTRNRLQIFEKFREISKQYRAPLWDFSDWEHSADREFFQNSQHLNADGAAAFSADLARRLNEELDNPGGRANAASLRATSAVEDGKRETGSR